MEPSQNPLATEKIGRLIAKFAIPSVLAMLVNALYNIVDQIFIGQDLGFLGNGAANVVGLIPMVALSLALLIGDGAAAYFSLRLGAGERENAARGVGTALWAVSVSVSGSWSPSCGCSAAPTYCCPTPWNTAISSCWASPSPL